MSPGLRRRLHRASVAQWSCCPLLLSSPHAVHAQETRAGMDRIAREFVGLVLELGEHDPGYVDAYYGPPQWQKQARAREREPASIAVDAERLAAELALIRPEDAWEARRVRFLGLQLEALQRVALPTGEEFRVQYVLDQPWSGYNWYEGKARSLIQINLDPPFVVSSFLGTACHEGYPGHHTFNSLLEQHLVDGRGWVELSVHPLYSPQEAERQVRFIEKYRSYVINYSYGRDLVGAYVDAVGGTDEAKRWAVFAQLLSSPTVPADLALPTAN